MSACDTVTLKWQPLETAPKDGTKIDVWMHIYASPRSFGMSDSFREIDVWFKDGKWVHYHKGEVAELYEPYVTHWMPIPDPPETE